MQVRGVPVLDRKGQIRHDGGFTEHPGLYLMGMQFLRHRKSALIDGAATMRANSATI
jgi:putative flavoprotein involved in K+ transport